MPTPNALRIALLGLLAALATAATAGCAAHQDAAQAPAGMKVGGPLTAAQVHAIQAKRQGNGSPPVQ